MERLEVVDRPAADDVDVGRVGVDAGEDRAPPRVTVGPRRVLGREVVRGPVDRIHVHRALHRRQLGAEARVDLHRLVRDLVDEVGAPVPLVTGRIEAVERPLQRRVRHRPDAVHERLRDRVEERRHRGRGVLLRPEVAPNDAAHVPQMDLLRERRPRRDDVEREEAVQLPRSRRQELAVDGKDFLRGLDGPEGRACDHGADLVETELEGGHDAEVAAAAPDRPVEVGVGVGARGHFGAVGEYHLCLEQVVDGEAALAGEVAEAAAERQATDAGRADDPARRREAVLAGRGVDLLPHAASADADGARLGIDLDVLEQREIDHDAVIDGSEPGAVVSAAADGDAQVVLARERDRLGDVVRARAARDQRRPPVDHRVVDGTGLLVVRVGGADQPAGETLQLLLRRIGGCHGDAHCASFVREPDPSPRLGVVGRRVMIGPDLLFGPGPTRRAQREWSDLTIFYGQPMYDVPGSLRLTSTFPFVGRSAELERLRTLLPRADGEGRRLVLLGGEAGSGKSRLVREFALEAVEDGALVLYGSCDAVVRTPYGPFVEALDQLARAVDATELRTALGTGGGELTRLLPDLALRLGDLPVPVDADPDTERHRLHTAVTDLLTGVGRGRPVVLVLEDGHWADAPTLLLLRHLARSAGDARVLLLATFRDTEADVPGQLSETLVDLRRSDDVVRLKLSGLTGPDVGEFVRRAAGGDLGPELRELAVAIYGLTEGNAFLVCELWREPIETNAVDSTGETMKVVRPAAELGTPESVREVVSQRLTRLAPKTSDLLELAATAGSEFELDILRRASALPDPELLSSLEEAVRSGMIEELHSPALAYRFTHELVRRALYDRLSGIRRAELHLLVGEALEGEDPHTSRTLADLAHHFGAAAPFDASGRGVEYNVLAARAAVAALAFDGAATRLRTALELGIDDPAARAEAYLELGNASHRAGKAAEALAAFRTAAEIARELSDPSLLARAAMGYENACWRPGFTDQGAAELLAESAAALGAEPSELRVGLLAGLARALDFQGEHAQALTVRNEAIAMARRLQDTAGLATVLMRSYWSLGASPLEEILEMLTEARDLGERLGDTEIRAEAMSWRVPAFVALGDLDSARREIAALSETAEQTAQPFMLHVAQHYGSAIALCDGNLAEAAALAIRSHESSRLLTGRDASGVYGIQMFSVRREQGRLAELAPVIRILAADGQRSGPWGPGFAAVLAELGMETDARRALERIAADGLDRFRESLWLPSLTYLTDACAALHDDATAALVYPELEPFATTNVMVGHLVSCYGAADRYLGMLAAVLGEAERAEEHFERALKLNRRMGARTWLAHTAYEYARLQLARRRPADALLREAAELAQRIGMPSLFARIRALDVSIAVSTLPDGLSAREVQILGLVARGLSNREIGGSLTISEHTAANHIRSILRKTGCANRTEAASYAHRRGLVRP